MARRRASVQPGRLALTRTRVVALVLAGALVVAAVVYRASIEAQARTAIVLSTTLRTPVLTWTAKALTAEPRVDDRAVVGGEPATLVRPGRGDRWPALVFVNGATARGRHHPDVQRLARGFARAGYLVVVPDLPGLSHGEITLRTLHAAVAVTRATADRGDARDGRVGLIGVSVGASLALLAAEDPSLAARVSVVAGIAPFTDLRHVVRVATTGTYAEAGRIVVYRADPYVTLAIGRSLAAALPPGTQRRRLLRVLLRVADDSSDPLAVLPDPGALHGQARAIVRLLLNRDPRRFPALYDALAPDLRAGLRRLSPLHGASRLRVPVELATAPHDKYFPVGESRALARLAPDVDVTVTTTLQHAEPRPSLRAVWDLLRFDGFVVRALRKARR